ncbi:hypothetical protein EXN66_Car010281 [Channa argus]|uniref:Uncharacterized protein n=1 Tax=Channa argus TaxID=215402 RepID=A0A6G1PWF5_CHAAH|nr:hypothetical protein EXN66_Car010281 [Channa argus]
MLWLISVLVLVLAGDRPSVPCHFTAGVNVYRSANLMAALLKGQVHQFSTCFRV